MPLPQTKSAKVATSHPVNPGVVCAGCHSLSAKVAISHPVNPGVVRAGCHSLYNVLDSECYRSQETEIRLFVSKERTAAVTTDCILQGVTQREGTADHSQRPCQGICVQAMGITTTTTPPDGERKHRTAVAIHCQEFEVADSKAA